MFGSWKLRKKIQCNERVQSEQRNIGMTSIYVIMGFYYIFVHINTFNPENADFAIFFTSNVEVN